MSAGKQGWGACARAEARRVYALRFRAYAERQYVTLGYEHEGWGLTGLVLALAALAVLALTGDGNAIVIFAIGAALWLAGHVRISAK